MSMDAEEVFSAPRYPAPSGPFPPSNRYQQSAKAFQPRNAPNPVRTEDDMMTLADRLEDESVAYKELCDELAAADADYHFVFHTALVNLPITIKPAEKRKAMASLEAHEQYAIYRMYQERQKASVQYLRSLSTKLDVMRSINANYRNQS